MAPSSNDASGQMKAYRVALKLTQQGLADHFNQKLGRKYDRSKVSRWEGGERPPLEVQNLVRSLLDPRPLNTKGKAEVIAISNFKGGVGKTTTATNLAVVLAQREHKVLLVDCDPQSSASKYMLGEDDYLEMLHAGRTLTDAVRMITSGSRPHEVLAPIITTKHGVDIIAASLRLARIDIRESGAEHLLKEMLTPLRPLYDWIILDSPPNPGLPLSWALTAASQMIIPVRTEPMDSSGLELILEEVQLIQRRLNESLRVFGVLPNQYDARKSVDQLLLSNQFKMDPSRPEHEGAGGSRLRVFDPIADEGAFGKAAMYETPLAILYPTSKGAQSYQQIANELVATMDANPEVKHG